MLARVGATLTALTNVKLPAGLLVSGELAYAVLPTVPSEFIVRAADGHTLQTIPFANVAARHTAYCEGFAEPSASG